MDTAKLFVNGRSQAVRLPKDYAFSGKEVYIKKVGRVVMLIPKDEPWEPFFESLNKFTDDFMDSGRIQGTSQNREAFE
jgi:antitoxin VapB